MNRATAISLIICSASLLHFSSGFAMEQQVALNPQPEPPGMPIEMKNQLQIKKPINPMEMRGLNPQPEPPKPADVEQLRRRQMHQQQMRQLNPQPEPPGQLRTY